MPIRFSLLSLDRMGGLHPDLRRVIDRAAAMASNADDFFVLEGVRSRAKMMENFGQGRTVLQLAKFGIPASYAAPHKKKVTWLRNPFASNHATGRAVDLAPWPLDWNDIKRFERMGALLKRAAKAENVPIVWGGDWTKKDYPHIELDRSQK